MSQDTLGASATITVVARADGGMVVTATGLFASCVICDMVDVSGNCLTSHTVNFGSISLSRDGSLPRCLGSGNGSASCTHIDDRALLHGWHAYRAIASDCAGSAETTYQLTLDNTPAVTVTAPTGVVSGPFDITGTAIFAPALSAVKGTITLYVDNLYTYIDQLCYTETCSFSYREIMGSLYDKPHGGPYTVKLIATGGGASASDQKTFTVDKTPTVAITAPSGVVASPL